MRYKHEASRHVLINAFLAPVRVVSLTTPNATFIAPASDLDAALLQIVDDSGVVGPIYTIEFKSLPRPQFDALGFECRLSADARQAVPTSRHPTLADHEVRVATVTMDGSTYVVEAEDIASALVEVADDPDGDEETTVVYTIAFKNMPRKRLKALGEFDGF